MADVRNRRGKASEPSPRVVEVDSDGNEIDPDPVKKPTTKTRVRNEDDYDAGARLVDVARVVTFLILASCALSYLISGGESFTWGVRNPPKVLQAKWWKAKFAAPIYLTDEELKLYDGTDASKPLYLAINGTIYDVSSNMRVYGPGGSYHFFTGVDASRAFVTGCFKQDRTPDMRGVEDMFLPDDDPEVDSQFTPEQLEATKKEELEEAKRKVHDQFSHWVNFFAKSPKYSKVGYVKREESWLEKEPIKELCEQAKKSKPTRKAPGSSEKEEN